MPTPRWFVAVFLGALLLAGCKKDPHSVVLPEHMEEADDSLKEALQALPPSERGLLAAYLIRHQLAATFGGKEEIPPNTTVGAAIQEQQQWVAQRKQEEAVRQKKEEQERAVEAQKKAEADALRAKVEQERTALNAKASAAVQVALLSIKVEPHDLDAGRLSDSLLLQFAFKNSTNQPISGVKGDAVIKDQFGSVIDNATVSMSDDITAGETKIWVGSRDFNRFRKEDNALADADFQKIQFSFTPKIIVFKDGTKIEVGGDAP